MRQHAKKKQLLHASSAADVSHRSAAADVPSEADVAQQSSADPAEEGESEKKSPMVRSQSLNVRPAKARPSKEVRLQLLLNSHLYRAGEDKRVTAILTVLRELWGSPLDMGPCCFVDLACGEGQIALGVVDTFPSCSAVGLDTERGDVIRAVGNLKRRGLEERCEFLTRSSVEVDLQHATVVLMCPSQAGASFLLRRVLPNSGLASGSTILSLGHPLSTEITPVPFQLILRGVCADKPTVFCYTWMMISSVSRRPTTTTSYGSASSASPLSLTSSLPSFPSVADAQSGAGMFASRNTSSPARKRSPFVATKIAW